MDETSEATHTTQTKAELFSADMHMFHITGLPQQSGVLTRKMRRRGARGWRCGV